jgi:hypothetical protein
LSAVARHAGDIRDVHPNGQRAFRAGAELLYRTLEAPDHCAR